MASRLSLLAAFLFALAALGLPVAGARAQARLARTVAGHAVDVRSPRGAVAADVLVLPGWNYDKALWGERTDLYRIADSLGWRLVMPQMLRSIYAQRFYPQTQAGYRGSPTLAWVTDSLLPVLQGLGLFDPRGTNYLIGLSTGARGVARVAWATDTLFAAGFAVSGDYAHTDTTDRLLIQSYGPYGQFRARWAQDEPLSAAASIRVPLYLAHATDDVVVPAAQSVALAAELALAHGRGHSYIELSPTGGHTWPYWGAALRRALPWLVQRRR